MGVEVNSVDESGYISLLERTNMRWLRNNNWAIVWHEIEPVEGVRNWNHPRVKALEYQLITASERGMNLLQIVRGTPGWARKNAGAGPTCGPIRQDKFYAFANFMQDLVRRYSAPPYNVRFWELGNEPDGPAVAGDNVFGCWLENNDFFNSGRHYGEMLKAVYPAIKAVSPESQVVMGAVLLDCSPTASVKPCPAQTFFDGIMDSGAGWAFDIGNFHAYDYWQGGQRFVNENWGSRSDTTGPSLIAKTDYMRGTLARYGYGNKPIINTEYALLCWQCKTTPPEFEQTKSIYIAQSNAAALAKDLKANVWYSLMGWEGFQTQLLLWNGTILPSYYALATSADQLSESTFVREETSAPGVRAYVFDRKGTPVWVAWAQSINQGVLNLPQTPLAIYNIYGQSVPTTQSVILGPSPVYIEFSK
jgi:hypothetical protein